MSEVNRMAGLELVQHLNSLTEKKKILREDLKQLNTAFNSARNAVQNAKLNISQIEDEIKAVKYNLKAERD